ncbi:bifunctional 4-hydroxy-2-oxoglutarate aldolase/2-dehydro-3-deoxy-phosphogluconate aldolase [Candidatus Omnitrophota bacterium]
MDLAQFKTLPLMGILRGVKPDRLTPLLESVISSRLKTVEITMNTPAAPELIRQAVNISKNRLTIGAGTVLTTDDLKRALDAGAGFIVLPTLVPEVVEHCAQNKIPVFPGAFTPQEIYTAWRAGASMVKVFPAKFFGPEYFKEIKGPFKDIELLACGGVNPENISSFFACGASAVAFGASVFKPDWIEKRDFSNIEKCIKGLIAGKDKT